MPGKGRKKDRAGLGKGSDKMNKSAINYCDRVWNVTGGCTHCSPGCDNCWAEQLTATRFKDKPRYNGLTKSGKWTGTVKLFEDRLDQPLRVKKPQVVFVNSQSDLFHPSVPFEFIDKIMAIVALCPQHKFLFLTKREKRMMRYMNRRCTRGNISIELGGRDDNCDHCFGDDHNLIWPLPNCYPGLTICNQNELDEKGESFLQVPGHKWLSIEPCLGDIDLTNVTERIGLSTDVITDQTEEVAHFNKVYARHIKSPLEPEPVLSQIVLGGESGRGARPMHPDWPRSIRDQCAAAGVSFFFKQWGKFVAPKDTAYHGSHKGWRFPVSCSYMKHDGTYYPSYPSGGLSGWTKIYRIGTKKAGRRLDGVEHNDLIWPSQAPRKRRCLGRP